MSNLVPDSVKGTGFYTPMDIAPGEFTSAPTPSNHDTNSTGYYETHQQEYSQCVSAPNNQGRLLSDEELRESICPYGDEWVHRCSAMHCNHCGLCDASEEIINLINTQKRLYAESVIGKNSHKAQRAYRVESDDFTAVVKEKAQNKLRAEQRARIK